MTDTVTPVVATPVVSMKKPPVDKWHVYQVGSPGWNRKDKKITLNYIQKVIAATPANHRAETRNQYRADGLLH